MPQHGQVVLEPETFLESLLADLRRPGRILVATHDNPDPDSLSCALGLKSLFETELGRDTAIGYGGMVGRAENRALVEACRIPLLHLDDIRYADFATLVLVDAQPDTGNNSIPPEVMLDLVVDHHPLREHTPQRSRWVDVRSDYGASATIVAQYLMARQVPITPLLATALLYALKSETQDLGVQANAVDRQVYFHLLPLVEPRALFTITHPKVSHEYFRILGRLVRQTQLYGKAAIVYLGRVSNPDLVAEMADQLMRLVGVEWALCMGSCGKELFLSLRTSNEGGGAGQMIQRLVRGLGRAGGHGMMAGGRVRSVPQDRKSRTDLAAMMRDRFLAEFNLGGTQPRSILDD